MLAERPLAFWRGLLIALAVSAVLLGAVGLAVAQVTPGANFPIAGCVNGTPIMWVNGGFSCIGVASPSVSSCGVTPSIYGTDFSGVIGVGTGAVTRACSPSGAATPSRCGA